jgi:hypothetical protein
VKPKGAAPRRNRFNDAQRSLDEARDCFLKAAFHLTEPNRRPNGVVEAVLYSALGILKLAAGDLSGRARARAEEVLREMRKTA